MLYVSGLRHSEAGWGATGIASNLLAWKLLLHCTTTVRRCPGMLSFCSASQADITESGCQNSAYYINPWYPKFPLRQGPIGVRIPLGQPTIGFYPWVGFRPLPFVSWPSCSASYAIEVVWAFLAFFLFDIFCSRDLTAVVCVCDMHVCRATLLALMNDELAF